jgi:hypothetical protein
MGKKATADGNRLRPPSYVSVPVSVAYAGVEDGVAVTMTRILGLCWSRGHRRTPPLTLAELCELTARPDATLRRHLRRLEHDLGWLRVVRDGLYLTLYPRVQGTPPVPAEGAREAPEPVPTGPDPGEPHPGEPGPAGLGHDPGRSGELWRALADAGVEEPARSELAADPALDPAWVRAWQLWTRHPHRQNLVNPVGALVQRLRSRQRPPEPYLRLAMLSAEEIAQLRESHWLGPAYLPDDLQGLHTLYAQVLGPRAAAATV